MSALELYQDTFRRRFSLRTDEDEVIANDYTYTIITKPILWNSAHITLASLDPAPMDHCTFQWPKRFFQCAILNLSLKDTVTWYEEHENKSRLALAPESIGVFSPMLLGPAIQPEAEAEIEPAFEPEIPINADAIKDEAREEGFKIPTKATLNHAEVISLKLLDLGVSPIRCRGLSDAGRRGDRRCLPRARRPEVLNPLSVWKR